MLLIDITIIVLRETLEASILVAVLLSVSRSIGLRVTWVFVSLIFGLVGSVVYGSSLGFISDWFNYAGQEVVNAALQMSVYFLILALIFIRSIAIDGSNRVFQILMSSIVSVALIREGSEIYVFYAGYFDNTASLLTALTSGFVGVSIGLSVGAIVFYSLAMANQSLARILHSALLILVAAGMVLQATQLLIQVDWISSGEPLWNSGSFIAESSVIGQMAYAIFGYEATPSLIELAAYSLSLIGLVSATLIANTFRTTKILSRDA